ncbi:response regulator [Thermodesulfobacteriota bacterium]
MLVMDIRLQKENGLHLTKKIKNSFPQRCVTIHSIYDSPEYRRIAKYAGEDHFLSKRSNSINDMITLIEDTLGHTLYNCEI